MGTWGYHFEENDTYKEIQELFLFLLKSGKTAPELTDMILEQYHEEPDYHIVVISLADCLWHCNMVTSRIYDMILQIQDENTDAVYLKACEANQDIIDKRKKYLSDFLKKIKKPPSKKERWAFTENSCSKPIDKGSVFWYRCNKKIYGAVVLDVQEHDYSLIAVSETLTHIPDTVQEVLISPLYTAAWFSDVELLPLKRMHFIGTIKIEDDFNGRAGFRIEQSGNLQIYNCGQSFIWKHSDRNINLHNVSMKDILHKSAFPVFHKSYM